MTYLRIIIPLQFLVIAKLSAAKPEWTNEKLSHKPIRFTDNQLDSICSTPMYRMESFLDGLVKPRVVGSKNHRDVGNFIADTLRKYNYDVELHEFVESTPNGAKTFRNIIGRRGKADRYLTLACHYDSKDCKTKSYTCNPSYGTPFDFVGATDSAFPCAVLLDVAASLHTSINNRKNQNLSLQLVFFDGEEAFGHWTATDSLYGSRALAQKWSMEPYGQGGANKLDQIDLLVLLDLLGSSDSRVPNNYANCRRSDLSCNLNHFSTLPEIESKLKGNRQCLKKASNVFVDASYKAGSIEDDHVPFLQRDVPVLHLISQPFPRVWHRETDNRSALDEKTMHDIASIIRVFTAQYLHLNV